MIRCSICSSPSTILARSCHVRRRAIPISSRRWRGRSDSLELAAHNMLPTMASSLASQSAIYRASALGRRSYATFTDLPANTSATSPPPLPGKQASYSNRLQEPEEAQSSSSDRLSADAFEELYSLSNAQMDVLYSSNVAVEDAPGTHSAYTPMKERQPLANSYRSTNISGLKPRIAAKKQSSTHQNRKAVSPNRITKSISEQPFEYFRMQHRLQQWRLDYFWQSQVTGEPPNQPHHQSLLSRYDWRLRNPWRTRMQSQKAAYAGKILYRKQAQASDCLDSPELQSYQEKYRRFITMEREESEKKALNRLLSNGKQSFETLSSSLEGTAEQLSGLQAIQSVRRRHRSYSPPSDAAQTSDVHPQQDGSLDEFQFENDKRKLFLFSRPDRQNFPPNTFHRGKMIFIWKCKYDSILQEWIVPELQSKGMTLQELSRIPARGYVMKEWANQIDVLSDDFTPQPGEMYRVDVGYDGTSFDRQEVALQKLALDAAEQRITNDNDSQGPAKTSRTIELAGTELRDLLLDHEPREHLPPATELESPVLMDDQYIASWARRNSRPIPLRLDGDPDLGLNETQLRAVASAVLNKFTLIQGPPGTGKTATLVAALKVLKVHFEIAAPILVCAHTNVVVDMIVDKCAQEGLRPLRFGRDYRIREDLREYGCEEQIKTHPLQGTLIHWSDEEDRLRDRKKEVSDLLEGKRTVFADLGNAESALSAEEEEDLKAELECLEQDIIKAHTKYLSTLRKVHADLIASADVCLTTCMSASGYEMGTADFPIVFIDEAGQCDEPTALIPLMKGARHAVLVGDHKQLPSVCSSDEARSEGLNSSLFERFKRQACVPSIQLDVQYRMLPEISAFPNKHFYAGNIKDSAERKTSTQAQPQHQPVVFFHHTHPETRAGSSTANPQEVDAIIRLLLNVQQEESKQGRDYRDAFSNLGIISMYAAQTNLIRIKARAALGEDHGIEIHTVDGFQGRDKDTVIISTVRSNPGGYVGFLSDPRRLNVALTRVRNSLYVFGNANTLSANRYWDKKDNILARYIEWVREVSHVFCPLL
ncbi:P-loop containing nucleoside triphosphate hydrolase protein [Cystobasidium minutum MCA 4210]|uniref:P-loop containing nucleoside triphosphate hydrolase protein n=1 Tax=Cystobasidium minutum MCA 4210 TaxID=1397322 RepID=UPI0034CF3FB5|eukprot:jgi/Rhomi1/9542/CE9541_1050